MHAMIALVLSLVSVSLVADTSSSVLRAPHAPVPRRGSGAAGSTEAPAGALFRTSDRCMGCHNRVIAPTGLDVSMGFDWRPTMMANAARDPYWHAAVRREVMDHPEARSAIEDKCSTCHMPMARYTAHLQGRSGRVFAHLPPSRQPGDLAADGVSCSVCHQIQPDGLGDPESFTGGFVVDETAAWGERPLFGPFEPAPGRADVMSSATGLEPRKADHIRESELCATCHTLYTHPLNEEGEEVGELPEQVPYLEWLHSDYPGEESCQSCHMPVVADSVPVTGVLGVPRDSVSRHVFRAANFFMPRMLNRHRDELWVQAPPREMDAASARAVEHLTTRSARLAVDAPTRDGDVLEFGVTATNLAGHKLPTAYPSRRAWLHVTVRDGTGAVVFESGELRPDGSVAGNENDVDPTRFEPHHAVIESEDQVQIWEAIMVDDGGDVTTGLLSGVRYAKDNRILPRGFDKATADHDVAVQGGAVDDPDFTGGGDGVLYRVDTRGAGGPLTVEVELWYQPIGFRWARNLEGYDAVEPERFVRWYDEMSGVSALKLTEAVRKVR